MRRGEIGIRVALGANARRVMAGGVRDGVSMTLAGAAVGFAAALATVQLVKALLYGVAPHDPITLIAALSLLIIAALACAIPALRAARVDPIVAMRAE